MTSENYQFLVMIVFEIRHVLLGLIAVAGLAWLLSMWWRRRKQLEQRLLTYYDSYEQLPVGVLVIDPLQRCVYTNPVGRHLLQLQTVPGPLPLAEPWAVELLSVQATSDHDSPTISQMLTLPTGKILRWWAIAMQGQHRLIVLQDISRVVQLKQTSKHLLNELAHELRTPVSVILTHLHILYQPDIADQIKVQSLDLVQKEAQHMQRLVHDMLELGGLEAREMLDHQALDLSDIVSHVMDEVAELATQKQIRIAVEIDPNLPLIEGNEIWLKRVYLNLIGNAIQHSRAGDRVSVNIVTTAHGVQSSVCDTGPGIPSKHLPLVSERFYQINRHGQPGSGLGLALVSAVLQRHNSHLEIESRHESESDQSGTCAQFILPARR